MANPLPVKADKLIPHRQGMKLIDQLTGYSEDDGTAVLCVHQDNLFVDNNQRLDSIVFIELLAQTAAAHSGYKALAGAGDPMFGFLVGVKDFKVLGSAGVGELLTLTIHRDFQMDNVIFLSGKVLRREEVLAEGILKLWEMPAAESEAPQIPIGSKNPEQFRLFAGEQIALLDSSFLNRKIIQQCNGFKSYPDSSTAAADFYYQENFIGFEGHFPGNPIVPGVLMLKTGMLLAELAGQKKYVFGTLRTAKFAKTVLPHEAVRYSLAINGNEIKVQVKVQDALCAKFTLDAK